MNDRFNTIAGWVLGGGIVLLGASLVAGEMFEGGRPEKMGYPIAGVKEEGKAGEAAEPPIAALLQTADATRGEAVFRKCAACHTVNQGGANGVGPNLYGVVGEAIASGRGGFAFSDALKSHGGNWDWENLNAWLRSPRQFASGTKMTFAGLSNPQERADLLVYLNAQGSNLPLPAAPAAAAPGEGNAADGNSSGAQAAAENSAAEVNGLAPNQPVLNSAQGGGQPRGGGEAHPASTPGH